VNSCVSYTIATSACCCLLVVFLAVSSLEFPTEIFLVTYATETLINEWDTEGTEISEGVYSLGWASREEERQWKIRIIVGEYQRVMGFLSHEWRVRNHPLLWIASRNPGMTCC
jgi:hypothetical protein